MGAFLHRNCLGHDKVARYFHQYQAAFFAALALNRAALGWLHPFTFRYTQSTGPAVRNGVSPLFALSECDILHGAYSLGAELIGRQPANIAYGSNLPRHTLGRRQFVCSFGETGSRDIPPESRMPPCFVDFQSSTNRLIFVPVLMVSLTLSRRGREPTPT